MLCPGQGETFGANAEFLRHEKQDPSPSASQIEQALPPAALIDPHSLGIQFQLVRFRFLKRLGLRIPFSARIKTMIPIEPIVEECIRVVVTLKPIAKRIMIVDGRILSGLREISACSGPDGCNHIEDRKLPENARGSSVDTDT
ncbi:MAG: hypothetical protein JW395_1615 [Nitrospira sp.]|nr:hypothetical protein [Nitrospira sp.]